MIGCKRRSGEECGLRKDLGAVGPSSRDTVAGCKVMNRSGIARGCQVEKMKSRSEKAD